MFFEEVKSMKRSVVFLTSILLTSG